VLVVVTATKFVHGAWIVIAAIPFIVALFLSIHRHYESIMAQLRDVHVGGDAIGTNHVVLVVRDLDAATAEAIGYVRSFRPRSFRAVYLTTEPVPPNLKDRWRELAGSGVPDLEPLPARSGALLAAVREYVSQVARQSDDFVTVIVPESIRSGLFGYLLRNRQLVQLKAGLLREPNVVVADVPVVHLEDEPVGVDARPLIPQRTVALVFVSAVHAPTIRAVNYARSLGAAETRAVHFDLDPDAVHRIEEAWFEAGFGIPLDIVETPFRDLSGPMLDEVRRYTARSDTLVSVVIPELIVTKWRHLLLHNQNALFVKRLLLFEERTVLTSVPFVLHSAGKTTQEV
jgi:hypothetical protein